MEQEKSFVFVRHMMNGVVFHAEKYENLIHLAKLISENDAHAIIIREEGVPVGIITSKDILKALIDNTKSPEEISADEVMTSPIVSIGHDKSLDEARALMLSHGVQKLPVKRGMDIIGMLIQNDLIKDLSWYREFRILE